MASRVGTAFLSARNGDRHVGEKLRSKGQAPSGRTVPDICQFLLKAGEKALLANEYKEGLQESTSQIVTLPNFLLLVAGFFKSRVNAKSSSGGPMP